VYIKNLKQIVAFGIVGSINTLSDFLLFNLFFAVAGLPLFVANVMAVSIVMSLSLFLNRKFVFKTSGPARAAQAAKFIGVTMIGLYVVQNIGIFLALNVLNSAHMLSGLLANEVVQANIAKAIGVVGSATWNFTLYKLWVFKKSRAQTAAEPSAD